SRDGAATAGVYVEETIGFFGMYTTWGIRRDASSAFGSETNRKRPQLPKISFSYPLSDKSFFPRQPYVSSLRLRVAYGQSGSQASRLAVLNDFAIDHPVTYTNGSTSSTVQTAYLSRLGNPDLKPERTTEWEGGFDMSFLENERVHAEVTLYRKLSRDAIVNV